MKKRAHIVVQGRVQGVSFRAYTQREARALGLTGTVRNLPNGDVEIVAEGPEEALEQLIRWAHHGPSLAHVRQVHVTYLELTGGFEDFRIAY